MNLRPARFPRAMEHPTPPTADPGIRAIPIPKASENRLAALDGLRGVAAVIVFLHHALMVFYPVLMGNNRRPSEHEHRALLAWFQHLPLGWLFNGPFAVSFFFVLSGFVLTLQVSQSKTAANFPRLLVRRFLRLFPLVFLASCGAYLLFEPGLRGLDALVAYNGITHEDFFEPGHCQLE